MKKMISFVLVLSIVLSVLSSSCFASASTDDLMKQDLSCVEILTPSTHEELVKDVQSQTLEMLDNMPNRNNISRDVNNPDHWKYVYETPVYKTVSGYASNQLPGGYNLPNGGSLFYTPEGGLDVSFTVSLADPWGVTNLSINIGEYTEPGSITGIAINLPADNNYYKIWVEKTVKITPWTSYNWDEFNQKWVKYYSGVSSYEYSFKARPVKV